MGETDQDCQRMRILLLYLTPLDEISRGLVLTPSDDQLSRPIESLDIILQNNSGAEQLRADTDALRERLGREPTFRDYDGCIEKIFIETYGSYEWGTFRRVYAAYAKAAEVAMTEEGSQETREAIFNDKFTHYTRKDRIEDGIFGIRGVDVSGLMRNFPFAYLLFDITYNPILNRDGSPKTLGQLFTLEDERIQELIAQKKHTEEPHRELTVSQSMALLGITALVAYVTLETIGRLL